MTKYHNTAPLGALRSERSVTTTEARWVQMEPSYTRALADHIANSDAARNKSGSYGITPEVLWFDADSMTEATGVNQILHLIKNANPSRFNELTTVVTSVNISDGRSEGQNFPLIAFLSPTLPIPEMQLRSLELVEEAQRLLYQVGAAVELPSATPTY